MYVMRLYVVEAEAAQKAGMSAVIVNRPGNKPLTEEQRDVFPIIENFNQLVIEESEVPLKKSKQEEEQS